MFSCPVWMLRIVPRLWGFCKVPVPSTSIGHKLEEDVYYGFGLLGPVVEKLQWSRCPNCGQTNNATHYVFE